MIFMSPYETPFYFIVFGIAVAPLGLLLFFGKKRLWYQCALTVFFLYMSFGGARYKQGIALAAYLIFQTALATAYFKYRQKHNAAPVFIIATLLAVLPLALVKLSPVLSESLSAAGFLGISYLTFRSVQVVVETRDGLIKEFGPLRYVLFLTFFPAISAGPIDRYRRFSGELFAPPGPDRYAELVGQGIQHIFMGFLYNYIIAHLLGHMLLPLVKEYVLSGGGFLGILYYMYVYSLYLFFDFAGYSKFAIGAACLMGYDIPPNFNKPFSSGNIKEFWNRWHMTLSFWFRDYVYMRLMLFFLKKKVFKSKVAASNLAYFALFLLMGLWHGITWYYIAYGLYHAAMICLTDAWLRFKKKHKDGLPHGRFTRALSVVITFHAVCAGFLIFSGFLNELSERM
ncbi:MAG: D-alanyl-lipoteichoic acid biosynthesis protein DltB [Clostridiales Family XIII bacterium]|jgi:membrane protein involved in D-alanine export|nr:D-alanyl-lipoteichoic acid biosynthesis protein DltB [Clostridiales Family XIII bacterium]